MDKFDYLRRIVNTLSDDANIASREDVATTQLEGLDTIREIEEAFVEMQQALVAALSWFNDFGGHSPIWFGGEAEVTERVRRAVYRANTCRSTWAAIDDEVANSSSQGERQGGTSAGGDCECE